jgi:hypothetical protein
MENEITQLIDREFINWLREKPKNSIVGVPTSTYGCLLFIFLTEKGKDIESIGCLKVFINGERDARIPSKIASFIIKLSLTYGASQITAEQALFAWERIDW